MVSGAKMDPLIASLSKHFSNQVENKQPIFKSKNFWKIIFNKKGPE